MASQQLDESTALAEMFEDIDLDAEASNYETSASASATEQVATSSDRTEETKAAACKKRASGYYRRSHHDDGYTSEETSSDDEPLGAATVSASAQNTRPEQQDLDHEDELLRSVETYETSAASAMDRGRDVVSDEKVAAVMQRVAAMQEARSSGKMSSVLASAAMSTDDASAAKVLSRAAELQANRERRVRQSGPNASRRMMASSSAAVPRIHPLVQ